jgi:hypothetical protein
MITPAQIEELAHILVGDAPGWQARFAKITGVSKGHISNMVTGIRPITELVAIKIMAGAKNETAMLNHRADEAVQLLDSIEFRPGEPWPRIERLYPLDAESIVKPRKKK